MGQKKPQKKGSSKKPQARSAAKADSARLVTLKPSTRGSRLESRKDSLPPKGAKRAKLAVAARGTADGQTRIGGKVLKSARVEGKGSPDGRGPDGRGVGRDGGREALILPVKVGAKAAAARSMTINQKAPERPRLPMRKIPNAELTRIRKLLAQKKQDLTKHLQSELVELKKPEKRHRTDLEEIASDTHDTDSLCEIMDIEASQIGQIDVALSKIDNGTYGVCEDCGGEIPVARLEALPFATQCIECKRKAEIAGQIAAEQGF